MLREPGDLTVAVAPWAETCTFFAFATIVSPCWVGWSLNPLVSSGIVLLLTRFSCQPEGLGSRRELQNPAFSKSSSAASRRRSARKVLLPPQPGGSTARPVKQSNASGCRRNSMVQEHFPTSVSGWPSGLRRQTQGVYLSQGHSGLRMEAWV